MEAWPCMKGWEGSEILKNPVPFDIKDYPLCEQDLISSIFVLKPGTSP